MLCDWPCWYKVCRRRWERREKEKTRRRDCNSFIHHKVACDFLPASVIPHDLGGFSLKSKALPDKTVQIEFDRYRPWYSAINLLFLNWHLYICIDRAGISPYIKRRYASVPYFSSFKPPDFFFCNFTDGDEKMSLSLALSLRWWDLLAGTKSLCALPWSGAFFRIRGCIEEIMRQKITKRAIFQWQILYILQISAIKLSLPTVQWMNLEETPPCV